MLSWYSDNPAPARAAEPSAWPTRLLLAAVATGGTLAYAASFRALPHAADLGGLAARVGIAAAVSWPVFGAALLLTTRRRVHWLDWADACLSTMAAGVVVLTLAASVNICAALLGALPAAGHLAAAHAALLLAGNLLMLAAFVRAARGLGMKAAAAVCLWILVLNGTFATTLFLLYRIGAT